MWAKKSRKNYWNLLWHPLNFECKHFFECSKEVEIWNDKANSYSVNNLALTMWWNSLNIWHEASLLKICKLNIPACGSELWIATKSTILKLYCIYYICFKDGMQKQSKNCTTILKLYCIYYYICFKGGMQKQSKNCTHPPSPDTGTFKALPGRLESWYLVCSMTLTQLEEIWRKFRSRRWGSSLSGLRTWDPPLSPPSMWAEFFWRTCLQSNIQYFPQKK